MVNYIADIPNKSYLGLGYGTSMINTDMYIWQENSSGNINYQAYTTRQETPVQYSGDCYTLNSVVEDTSSVSFSLSRPLDCNLDKSYVIPLGESFDIVNAWLTDTEDVDYHGSSNRVG